MEGEPWWVADPGLLLLQTESRDPRSWREAWVLGEDTLGLPSAWRASASGTQVSSSPSSTAHG